MRLYKQTIKLEHLGTTDVMEWIKAHPTEALCLDHTFFEDKFKRVLVVSLVAGNSTIEREVNWVDALGELDAFEYKGMRRYGCPLYGWYFEIDGNVYYCSM